MYSWGIRFNHLTWPQSTPALFSAEPLNTNAGFYHHSEEAQHSYQNVFTEHIVNVLLRECLTPLCLLWSGSGHYWSCLDCQHYYHCFKIMQPVLHYVCGVPDNLPKRLSEFGVGDSSRLKCDDFQQNFQLVLQLVHWYVRTCICLW